MDCVWRPLFRWVENYWRMLFSSELIILCQVVGAAAVSSPSVWTPSRITSTVADCAMLWWERRLRCDQKYILLTLFETNKFRTLNLYRQLYGL